LSVCTVNSLMYAINTSAGDSHLIIGTDENVLLLTL